MTMTRTARVTRTRAAAITAALACATLALTGCAGSSSIDGTYYSKDVNGTSDLGQLVVNGNTVTHHEYECEGVYQEPDVTSTGELNDDRTQIVWTVAGKDRRNERTGTEAITTSESSISVGNDVYIRDDSDVGKTLLSTFKANCSK
ncbi:hypothetical protein [Streptomyces sp. NPDC056061]|uniref:hypothetical protein n=1 Tax=Streptomyces sp. NPDC056061 TaxID=3345700 RepID=UPI0035E1A284